MPRGFMGSRQNLDLALITRLGSISTGKPGRKWKEKQAHIKGGGCMAKSGVPHLNTLCSNTRKEPDDNDLKMGLVSQSVEWFKER